MIRWLIKDAGWKLLSLAIAVALWMTFVGSPDLVTSLSAPIEYLNVPAELEILPQSGDRVRLEVRGPATRIRHFEQTSPAVVLDLSGVDRPGERTFAVTADQVSLPPGLALVRAVPAHVRLRFERRSRRVVPVRLQVGTPPPPGYRLEANELEPREVTVVGPESRVRQVEYAETDPVDLGEVLSRREFTTHVAVRDPEVRLEQPCTVKVRVTVGRVPPSGPGEGQARN